MRALHAPCHGCALVVRVRAEHAPYIQLSDEFALDLSRLGQIVLTHAEVVRLGRPNLAVTRELLHHVDRQSPGESS